MKKLLFSLAILSAALVSCTKSDVLDAPSANKEIGFNPYAGRTVTKATTADINTLGSNGFQVYAFMHNGTPQYDNAYMNKVVKKGAEGWEYDGNAYWPTTYNLDFIAYGLNTNITTSESNLKDITFTVQNAVASQTDLLVAEIQKNQTYENTNEGTVSLNFSHLLSRIGFSLITKANNNTLVTIKKVELKGNFFNEGTVDLTKTASTTLNQEEESETKDRPFIVGSDDKRGLVTYSLLANGSFSSKADGNGVAIFDNSMLYELNKGEKEGDEIDDVYEMKVATEGGLTADDITVLENAAAASEANRYMMVIPVSDWKTVTDEEKTLTNAQLVVQYFLPGAGTMETITIDLVNESTPIIFEAGKSYDFKFKISTNEIGFSVEVETWDTASGLTNGSQTFEIK